VALATPATASVIYSYVGNPYFSITDSEVPAGAYTTSMFITARIELAGVVEDVTWEDLSDSVLSYEVSDGRVSLTESNSTILFRELYIRDGNIIHWDLWVQSQSDQIGTGTQLSIIISVRTAGNLEVVGLAECLTDVCAPEETSGDTAQTFSRGGGWTLVPEPGAHALLAVGLAGMAATRARARRRRHGVAEGNALRLIRGRSSRG